MSLIPLTLVLGQPAPSRMTWLSMLLRGPGGMDTLLLADAAVGNATGHAVFAPVAESGSTQHMLAGGIASVCVCCIPQRGLATALREATWRFARSGQRQFSRVIVDHGGADPSAVLRTLLTDETVTRRYRLEQVMAVADIGTPPWVLESDVARLWAVADVLMVPPQTGDAARSWLGSVAPEARVVDADADATDLAFPGRDHTSPAASAWLAQAHGAISF